MSRLERQSFLGKNSDEVLAATTVGVVGLGGGGSHIVQQLAHLGIGRFLLVDPDVIDLKNTNRLVGSTLADVAAGRPKVEIAERVVRGVQPDADVRSFRREWQFVLNELKSCDVIVAAVDSFNVRDQLEHFARRYLIPYVDIGMGVLKRGEGNYLVSGQVILSSPGRPCLRCCNLINDERLAREAEEYGAAGGRPQVVWPNGVLASTAVGVVVELLTPWHGGCNSFVYLEYDGNRKTVSVSNCVAELTSRKCLHYLDDETGDPAFDVRLPSKTEMGGEQASEESKMAARKSVWRRLVARLYVWR